METNEYSPQEFEIKSKDILENVSLADYRDLDDEAILEWLKNSEELPAHFWEKMKTLSGEDNINKLMDNIRYTLYHEIYNDEYTKPNSLEESRFTSLNEILEKKLASCGATSKVMTAVLRKFGVPVKLVHGQLKDPHGEGSHAWISVYQPKEKQWVEKDVTDKVFELNNEFSAAKFYHDWDELKQDLNEK